MDPRTVCLTFDVEWAVKEVIDDVVRLLDERGIKGTFFVTHAGVIVEGHERGIHPNFRRNGDTYRALENAGSRSDEEVYEHVISSTMTFAPEAKGVRSHSLFFDTTLLRSYRNAGLEYDSTLRMELVGGLRPFWKQADILEIPTYYADYYDLDARATNYDVAALDLAQTGLKVLDFHPNLVYANVATLAEYAEIRPIYRDAERLRAQRGTRRGVGTLFEAILDEIVRLKLPTATLGEINASQRASRATTA